MTYEEFEKSLVVEPTYRFMTDDMAAVELRFQAGFRKTFGDYETVNDDTRKLVIERIKRRFYESLFRLYVLPEEFGMTEDEFVRWCRYKFYSDKIEELS